MMWIHSSIKVYRERRGLDQGEFGRRVGVHRNTVIKWESGKTMPSRKHLLEIASALNVTVEQLFAKAH